ncbi:hypothetical protein LCGC14_2436570 [marine sediment metagenome]|uniref:Uncharacterized protein n=1 Tax=marine sediment metagenome TaxID=412755 RepID=A0A0F9EEA8_9ZZZZ
MTYILTALHKLGYEGGSQCGDSMADDILKARFTTGGPRARRGIQLLPGTKILYTGPDWFVSKDEINIIVHHVTWVTRVIIWSGPFVDLVGI